MQIIINKIYSWLKDTIETLELLRKLMLEDIERKRHASR